MDFLIDVSSIDTRDEDAERDSRERVARLVLCWREHESAVQEKPKDVDTPALSHPSNSEMPNSAQTGATTSGRRPNVLQQTAILLPRSTKNMLRGYPELVGHFVQAVMLGLLMGITFWQLKEQPSDIQSLKTLAFQVVPVYAYMSQVVWTFKWCTSLVVYDREREDSLYAPAAWVLSEMLAWAPMNIIGPLVYGIMVYFISDMRHDALHYNFGVFIIDMIMVQFCFVAWSLFAASIEVRISFIHAS